MPHPHLSFENKIWTKDEIKMFVQVKCMKRHQYFVKINIPSISNHLRVVHTNLGAVSAHFGGGGG